MSLSDDIAGAEAERGSLEYGITEVHEGGHAVVAAQLLSVVQARAGENAGVRTRFPVGRKPAETAEVLERLILVDLAAAEAENAAAMEHICKSKSRCFERAYRPKVFGISVRSPRSGQI